MALKGNFLLYGAYGYTGKLIAQYADKFGLVPLLAGRNEEKLKALSEETGFPCKAFDLSDRKLLEETLREVKVVLHAAGPFKHTARPMIESCLRTSTNYLDITGEIEVFELAASLNEQAKRANIMLMPGVGFDVVPSDCLAKFLSDQMPTATHLQLAFSSTKPGFSQGTALTMAENLGEGAAYRKDGKIVKIPLGHKSMMVPFIGGEKFAMIIPWGDVSTAYYSTGIPNIETYMGFSKKAHKKLKWQRFYNWLLKTDFVRNRLKKKIKNGPAGPSSDILESAKSLLWAKVWNADKELSARLEAPEGYKLTALTSLNITRKVLEAKVFQGFQTPARAYGADLIMEIDGVTRELV
jgi:short subunit dehydrogenase-like uncharacterized protein